MEQKQKRLNVILRGDNRKYFEEQKNRLGEKKDTEALRKILKEHQQIIDVKY